MTLLERFKRGVIGQPKTYDGIHHILDGLEGEDYRLQCDKEGGHWHCATYEITTNDPLNHCPYCGRDLKVIYEDN